MLKEPQVINPKFVKFFQSPTGRKISVALVGGATIGLFSFNYLPNTIYGDWYRSIVEHYTHGIPTKLDDKIKKRVELAVEKINLSETCKKYLHPFTVTGFNVVNFGSFQSAYGAWLGIPLNFTYDKPSDVDRSNIHVRDQTIKWDSENGKELQNSLVFTESEQIFGICNALLELDSYKFYIDSLIPTTTVVSTYAACQQINFRALLHLRPFYFRYGMYSMVSLFAYGLYALVIDMYHVSLEQNCDEKLAAMGKDMVETGISYYTKLLKRNVAIRQLSGIDLYTPQDEIKAEFKPIVNLLETNRSVQRLGSVDLYTSEGDDYHFFRYKIMPLTERKKFFEEYLENMKSEQTN